MNGYKLGSTSMLARFGALDILMGGVVEITNLDHSAADLRPLASRENNGEAVRRLWRWR
jgi:hypothetical protein